MQSVIEKTGNVDSYLLADKLKQRGDLEVVGGLTISQIGDWAATKVTLEHHCRIVKDLSAHRKMIKVAEIIAGSGYTARDSQEYVRDSLKAVSQFTTQTTRLAVKPISDGFAGLMREIYSEKPPVDMVMSGLGLLDLRINGFPKGLVTVIAGDTSMGKSLVALNLAMRMAQRGTRVLYATMEDTIKNQQRRAISIASAVALNELKQCQITDPVKCRKIANAATVGQLPIDFMETPTTADELCNLFYAYSRKHKEEHEDVVLIADHLLYFRGQRRESDYERVTAAMRSLADCGKATGEAVIALSQINRDHKGRAASDKAPMKSDLKSSGAIEQDARLILGVYRPWEHDKEADPTRLELHILKNTDGPAGFPLVFGVDLTTVSIFEEQEGYREGY
jgi:replicative DNA helicase